MGLPLSRLRRRERRPEIMDQPGLDDAAHVEALRGLERINRLSRSARILWPAIARLARARGTPIRVLDIATGAGDVPLQLWKYARRERLDIDFSGVDISGTALDHARANNRNLGAGVDFRQLDALCEPLPSGFDVFTCSLFLHHLEEGAAVCLLRKMAGAVRHLVLVNDLIRCRSGYALAWAGSHVLSASPVVHVDGPRSVEGAFTMPEALDLARQAGLKEATVSWRWPYRYLLKWSRL